MSDQNPRSGFSLARIGILKPLVNRNFRLLWTGSLLSYVGAQLTLIAFPWLVLKLSGDALAMGTVFALAGIPRALFMLLGGVFTDRFSPRLMMLWINAVRMLLMFGFSVLIYLGLVEMWMVYVLALAFGLIDAFYWPASSAIIPRLLSATLLPAGNSLMQGMGQISLMLGPLLAGIIIAGFSDGTSSDTADLPGIAFVFFIDGVGFLISIFALAMIRLPGHGSEPGSQSFSLADISRSIGEGFVYMWNDTPLRLVIMVFTVFSLFFRGPYIIGIPMISELRFEEGALAFGMISAAFGVGSLVGVVVAGSFRRPPQRYYGYFMMLDVFVIGLAMLVYGFTDVLSVALIASAVCGMTDGYISIILISWIQTRVTQALMGRVMSLIMFFIQGVTPVSAAAAGALFRFSLEGVFYTSGLILISLAILGLTRASVRNMEHA